MFISSVLIFAGAIGLLGARNITGCVMSGLVFLSGIIGLIVWR